MSERSIPLLMVDMSVVEGDDGEAVLNFTVDSTPVETVAEFFPPELVEQYEDIIEALQDFGVVEDDDDFSEVAGLDEVS